MSDDIEAYSTTTRKTYVNWAALLAAESNGFVVVGTSTRPDTAAIVIGPYSTQGEARKAQNRLRAKWKRDEAVLGHTVSTSVRILWKEKP